MNIFCGLSCIDVVFNFCWQFLSFDKICTRCMAYMVVYCWKSFVVGLGLHLVAFAQVWQFVLCVKCAMSRGSFNYRILPTTWTRNKHIAIQCHYFGFSCCQMALGCSDCNLSQTRSSALAETRGNTENLLMSRNLKGKYDKNTPSWARHCVRTDGSGTPKREIDITTSHHYTSNKLEMYNERYICLTTNRLCLPQWMGQLHTPKPLNIIEISHICRISGRILYLWLHFP
jgi:hypothetical protein